MTPVSHELAVHSTRGDVHVYDPYAHYTLCGRRWWRGYWYRSITVTVADLRRLWPVCLARVQAPPVPYGKSPPSPPTPPSPRAAEPPRPTTAQEARP